jgi:Mn2+/Fe2+ NRAMP family transporter
LAGIFIDFMGFSPIKALYWTAVLNGLLAPFLLTGILLVAADRKIMRGQPSSRLALIVVGIATAAMFAASLAMFVL